MTVFTFDDLAVHAYASGRVDAWNRLIDEAIDLGRVYWVWRLWIIDKRLCYQNFLRIRDAISPCEADAWSFPKDWHPQIADRAEGKVPA